MKVEKRYHQCLGLLECSFLKDYTWYYSKDVRRNKRKFCIISAQNRQPWILFSHNFKIISIANLIFLTNRSYFLPWSLKTFFLCFCEQCRKLVGDPSMLLLPVYGDSIVQANMETSAEETRCLHVRFCFMICF